MDAQVGDRIVVESERVGQPEVLPTGTGITPRITPSLPARYFLSLEALCVPEAET